MDDEKTQVQVTLGYVYEVTSALLVLRLFTGMGMCGVFFIYTWGRFSASDQWPCFAGSQNDYPVSHYTDPWAEKNVTDEWNTLFVMGFVNWALVVFTGLIHLVFMCMKKKQNIMLIGVIDYLNFCFGSSWLLYASITRFRHRGRVCSGFYLTNE